jgi:release factor glutamine methyltransferase
MTTLQARLSSAYRRLVAAGIDAGDAALDTEVMARHALGWDRAYYFARIRDPLPAAFDERFAPLLERRCHREPVAQIIGSREFWGLEILVTRDVLIPRPETELLIEVALARLTDHGAPWMIADVGTGSGCVAVALAREFACAHLTATDLSADALVVARDNATRHGVADRISFHLTRFLDALPARYDLIVSNPPYVPAPEMTRLAPEVARYEPALALCGGLDGLDPTRELVASAAARLRPGGWLLMELGAGQADALTDLVARHAGLSLIDIRPDLQGIPRAAVIARVGNTGGVTDR